MKEIELQANEELAMGTDGFLRIINTETHKCRRVYRPQEEDAKFEGLDCSSMDLSIYQRYLKDRFNDEDCPIKSKKLIFRGYRVSCTKDDGFIVEDMMKKYAIVEGTWEGVPTPEELGDFFEEKTTAKEHKMTAEEAQAAVERGKADWERRKAEKAAREELSEKTTPKEYTQKDFEKFRKDTLTMIAGLREAKDNSEFEKVIVAIPFKKWKRKAKALLKQYNEKKIRRGKFLDELQSITEAETFIIEEKRHRSTFKGTVKPEHKSVGYLRGDKLEVDNKLVDAVPFLEQYLLSEEPRVMSQLMKYAKGEITDREFMDNPIDIDWKISYKKNQMANTAHNAQVLSIVFEAVGLIAPQDLLYETTLRVGDKILLYSGGEFIHRTIAKVECGVEVGRGFGIYKTDKWILWKSIEQQEEERSAAKVKK